MSTLAENPRRLALWSGALLVAVGLLAVQFLRTPGTGFRMSLYDFKAFWAASQLNQVGADPYDPELLQEVQHRAEPGGDVLVMWPAPWTLGVLKPFCVFDSQPAHLGWVLFNLFVLVFALDWAWRHFGGAAEYRGLAWLLAFLALPSYMVLVTGQLGPLMLLGFVGFLVGVKARADVRAGAWLALAAFKPQLSLLFWLALLVWVIQEKRWKIVLGGLVGTAILLAIPLLENPHLLQQYWQSLSQRNQTHGHLSPVLATALWLLCDRRSSLLLVVPLLPALVWGVGYWLKNRRDWDWDRCLPALLFVSFLAAPYGAWPFDLVVLLFAFVPVLVRFSRGPRNHLRTAVGAFVVVNLVALVQLLAGSSYFWFLWLAPAWLLLYVAGEVYARRSVVA